MWGKRKDGQAYQKGEKKGIKSSSTTPVADIHLKTNGMKGNRDYFFDMPPERIMRNDFEEFLKDRKNNGYPEWNGGFKAYVDRERMIRMENKEDHVRDQLIDGKLNKEKYGLTDHDIEVNSHRFMKVIMEIAKNQFVE